MRRIAITGIGVVSSLGLSGNQFFTALCEGRSGIASIRAGFADRLQCSAVSEVADFDPGAHFSRAQLTTLDRTSQFALVAARQALADAGLDPSALCPERSGCYLGTGMGGTHALEDGYSAVFAQPEGRVKPFTVINSMNNAPAAHIAITFGLAGPVLTYSTACSSSGMAIGEAMRAIRHGYADVMLAGGAEALLTYGVIRAWEALRTLAPADADVAASCRPFSKDRAGLILGEGAGLLVLEEMESARARGARIYGELAGYGASCDAQHLTRPSAIGQVRAMQQALADAGVSQVDHINAHGTATPVGDVVETQAIRDVFQSAADRIPVAATKSMHGHLMGATAAVEMIAAVMALHTGTVPPTRFLRVPDPECDLDYVADGARDGVALQTVMSNSFAFGGSNAVLIARRV